MNDIQVRSELHQWLVKELLGPFGGPEEEIIESPVSRYICGMLAPGHTAIDPDQDEKDEAQEEEKEGGGVEDLLVLKQTMNPASIGLSFIVDSSTRSLCIQASWGMYSKDSAAGHAPKWKRQNIVWEETVNIFGETGRGSKTFPGAKVSLQWLIRRYDKDKFTAVSLFLTNIAEKPDDGDRHDELWLFQPDLKVSGSEETPYPFIVRRLPAQFDDADEESNRLLYRDHLEFASGHGVSAEWEQVKEDRAGMIRSVVIPSFEVPTVKASDSLDGVVLTMLDFSKPDQAADINDKLMGLIRSYETWLKKSSESFGRLDLDMRKTAEVHLSRANKCVARMVKGIQLLKKDSDVLRAFCFANAAIRLQRQHAQLVRSFHETGHRTLPEKEPFWYPFQLAFILMNLEGIAVPESPDRQIGDLLWFPTGGGKTEAYLGLTAFALALRRKRSKGGVADVGAGVAVIMRYTLRLLTLQQFQRASLLICACEVLRRQDFQEWEIEPFRIGLWVGSSATPNSFADSKEALEAAGDGSLKAGGSTPMQLTSCPWCGETLRRPDWYLDNARKRTLVACPRKECDFSRHGHNDEGIPVVVVDEEIYHLLPAFIIATVDKFARLPFVGDCQSLFGLVNRRCSLHGWVTPADKESHKHPRSKGVESPCDRLRPPALIIQDELHLIAGPLGTLVGLYETAIDWLCSWKLGKALIRPKVIASTATIRRAPQQIRSLFNREISVFPQPILDASNSYFAQEISTASVPGRLYLGLLAPGKSMKWALGHLYAVLLAVAEKMRQDGSEADPYMTLVGYFSSLRELGGARRVVSDDVRTRLEVIAKHAGLGIIRRIDEPEELTSNVPSEQIPTLLRRLEEKFSVAAPKTILPIDVVLASNMLSVGVDIKRLGLMVVAGQPKTASEYIQVTSRIGRQHPGLVITLYKWTRPRDISHYEKFRAYHQSLYRYVEGVSVTPFSSRARDRGLKAVLVAMARLGNASLSINADAGNSAALRPALGDVAKSILQRIEDIEQDPELLRKAKIEINAAIDAWIHAAGGGLRYWTPPQGSGVQRWMNLLRYADSNSPGLWEAANSLRGVEAGALLNFIGEDHP